MGAARLGAVPFGVEPAAAYLAVLDEAQRADVRDRCHELLPTEPFDLTASAWCAVPQA